ncbi:PhzF family phenazine biosynthesis protein [Streptomyces sp. NPDC088354]|uniref:PhzF family phenazine biosynthesis protein n=1 Tax=unclassified Streptomyces TaxID=2593676 RepID=UPI0029BF78B1|nr:PhzF family phenazine biosynthesis protein [Streptomyces sp. MI02-7b]MDX3073778.1 PhzF family phenazine biosynthesis protein [Streptomyces sp. MI02-7b]
MNSGYDIVRVFCAPDGGLGNRVAVVRDEDATANEPERATFARQSGLPETVFVNDAERGVVDVRIPGRQLPFAGSASLAAAWLLDAPELITPAGVLGVRLDGEFNWVEASPEWARKRTLRQYASPREVDTLPVPAPGEWLYAWAWEDEAAGRVRARGFPGRPAGPAEVEASGSAALLLTERLNRALNITQGRGSQILTAPAPHGLVELGGRVRLDRAVPGTRPRPAITLGTSPSSRRRIHLLDL